MARAKIPRIDSLKVDRVPTTGAERAFDVVMVAESEGGYSVLVPELPSVATQGETIEEARTNAREAIETYLEVMRHGLALQIPGIPAALRGTNARSGHHYR